MAHFAKVVDGIVTQVIVAEQDFIDSGVVGDVKQWIEISTTAHSKTFAGIGYQYFANLNIFVPPKIYDSWILDTEKAVWKAPVDYPNDTETDYEWNEDIQNWQPISDNLPSESETANN